MHLRAIRIRGFKSFPEPVEVRLEPGVAVVVGPSKMAAKHEASKQALEKISA